LGNVDRLQAELQNAKVQAMMSKLMAEAAIKRMRWRTGQERKLPKLSLDDLCDVKHEFVEGFTNEQLNNLYHQIKRAYDDQVKLDELRAEYNKKPHSLEELPRINAMMVKAGREAEKSKAAAEAAIRRVMNNAERLIIKVITDQAKVIQLQAQLQKANSMGDHAEIDRLGADFESAKAEAIMSRMIARAARKKVKWASGKEGDPILTLDDLSDMRDEFVEGFNVEDLNTLCVELKKVDLLNKKVERLQREIDKLDFVIPQMTDDKKAIAFEETRRLRSELDRAKEELFKGEVAAKAAIRSVMAKRRLSRF